MEKCSVDGSRLLPLHHSSELGRLLPMGAGRQAQPDPTGCISSLLEAPSPSRAPRTRAWCVCPPELNFTLYMTHKREPSFGVPRGTGGQISNS